MSVRVLIHTAAVEDVSVYTRSREPHRSHGSLCSHTQSKMEEKIEKKSDGTCAGASALRSRRSVARNAPPSAGASSSRRQGLGSPWTSARLSRTWDFHVCVYLSSLPCCDVVPHSARERALITSWVVKRVVAAPTRSNARVLPKATPNPPQAGADIHHRGAARHSGTPWKPVEFKSKFK